MPLDGAWRATRPGTWLALRYCHAKARALRATGIQWHVA